MQHLLHFIGNWQARGAISWRCNMLILLTMVTFHVVLLTVKRCHPLVLR
jgi:hypothetical protein